jgi:rhodanese-related sulfurtransferase
MTDIRTTHQHAEPFSNVVTPLHAWAEVSAGRAHLVDVRTHEEHAFVGRVPKSHLIPWALGPQLSANPHFLNDLAHIVKDDKPVYLLCRSGKRSEQAAREAIRHGWPQVFSVLEGFEGDINGLKHRGETNGWKYHGLPWVQD